MPRKCDLGILQPAVLKIEITIGQPKQLVLWLVLGTGLVAWWQWVSAPVTATLVAPEPTAADAGGPPDAKLTDRLAAQNQLVDARADRAVADRQAEILRYQMQVLEQQQAIAPDDQVLASELRQARVELLNLLDDKREAEKRITEALASFRTDSDLASVVSRHSELRTATVSFTWPVEPLLGISAPYHSTSYLARFGVAHEGIDIPVNQGTIIRAPADAIVSHVNDRGLGYNSLILSHAGGYATLYGHVSAFLVKEGQAVRAGDPIAKSGATPGTPGAGLLTTGPHLHFEVLKDGEHIDPQSVLPAYQ